VNADKPEKGWPNYLLRGRLRTSTAALMVAFVALFWLYNAYEPPESTPEPAPQVIPPGFVPDPNYTWVPRTQVQDQYTDDTYPTYPTTTISTTLTTSPTGTTSATDTTSPTSPTSPGPSTTTTAPGLLPGITLPTLPPFVPPGQTTTPPTSPTPG